MFNKQFLFILLYLFGLSILIAYADGFPLDIEKRLNTNRLTNDFYILYDGILNKNLGGPYIYRIMVPYTVLWMKNLFSTTGIEIVFYINLMSSFGALLLCFLITKRIGNTIVSIFSSTLLALYILYTQTFFVGVILVETQDIVNVTFFMAILYSLINQKMILALIFMVVGQFNRETPIFLLIPLVIYAYQNKRYYSLILGVFLNLGTYFLIRYFIQDESPQGDWMLTQDWEKNIPFFNEKFHDIAIAANKKLLFYLIPIVTPLLFFGVKENKLFKSLLIMGIIFIPIHYYVAVIDEIRLFLPIVSVLIPFIAVIVYEGINNSNKLNVNKV